MNVKRSIWRECGQYHKVNGLVLPMELENMYKITSILSQLLYMVLLLLSIQSFKEKKGKRAIIFAFILFVLVVMPFAVWLGVAVSM